MEEAEVVKKMDEWREQIVNLTKDYSEAIKLLKDVKDSVEASKKNLLIEYKPLIFGILTMVVVVIALLVLGNFSSWCSLTFSKEGISVKRDCSK